MTRHVEKTLRLRSHPVSPKEVYWFRHRLRIIHRRARTPPEYSGHEHSRTAHPRRDRAQRKISTPHTQVIDGYGLAASEEAHQANQLLLLLKPSSAASDAAPAHTSLRARMDQIESPLTTSSIQSLSATQTRCKSNCFESPCRLVQIAELKRELKRHPTTLGGKEPP